MSMPRVTIRPHDHGWASTCARCRWALWRRHRPTVDRAAIAHYNSHARSSR